MDHMQGILVCKESFYGFSSCLGWSELVTPAENADHVSCVGER